MSRFKRIVILSAVILLPVVLAIFFVYQPVFGSYSGEYTPQVQSQRLQSHVIKLSEEIKDRSYYTEGLADAADYVQEQFSTFSQDVSVQRFVVDEVEYRNVIVRFGPHDQQLPVIVVGAHFDAYSSLPGADDNASGTAGLIELGRLLSQHESFSYPVELVAYTLEEPPYFRTQEMGSYHHAESLHAQGIDVDLMISLEMIGYFSDEEGSQSYPLPLFEWIYPTKGNYIGVIGRFSDVLELREVKGEMLNATPLAVHSMLAPEMFPEIDYSDHLNYWQFDYPALMVTDTAFYRNRAYHTSRDTWQRLDYERMAMVVDGVYNVVTSLASTR
ncbi:M28 family peptidase [Corallincola spongiicola]|uniref:M28 family peptidase n=1 Tax=Corallincola spongiicola TaxID=2520508 RepID=A0ABY1WRU8_9GAMM|nr:M28 family peptidase [Corallincola spongiicola]TAA47447.1 M28 family peptidase [Corallincola spongiicola]